MLLITVIGSFIIIIIITTIIETVGTYIFIINLLVMIYFIFALGSIFHYFFRKSSIPFFL